MLALLLLALAQAAPRAAQAAQSPSVLVVVLDDVGYWDLAGCPTIQGFAAQSLSFSRAYSWPVCSPSRLAAMFGTWPRRAGMGGIVNTYAVQQSPSPYPSHDLLSIAEALKPTHATGFFGKYHLGRPGGLSGDLFDVSSSPFVQGWDTVRACSPDSVAFGPGTGYYSWDQLNNGSRSISTVYATDRQADAFLDWWTTAQGARLGWLAFNAAHEPWDTPPGYGIPANTREAFLNVLAYADRRLADVLAAVDLADTFVILLGDNGTPDEARPTQTQSGFWKETTHEGGIRVPLMIAGPGILPGVTNRLVSLVDLPATICALLDVPWRGATDGLSMIGLLSHPFVLSEVYEHPSATLPQFQTDDLAIIEPSWKLRIIDPDGPGPLPATEETYVLGVLGEAPATPPANVLLRLHSELAGLPARQ